MNKLFYNIINIVILLSVLYLFKCKYLIEISDITNVNSYWFSFLLVVIFVHIIKALRLYIALYGTNISITEYIKTYCKVTPVSIIFPFKLGEIFRIYSYGYLIKNYLKSTIIIMLDRFMDTAALLSVTVILAVLKGYSLSLLIYLLIAFSLFMLFLYKIFPNMYKFWKDYYLQEKATKRKMWSLHKLEILNKLYNEIKTIIKGRGIILYALSVFAWMLELFNLLLVKEKISQYLFSALNLAQSAELNMFITISIIFLMIVYLIIKLVEFMKNKEVCG